MTSSKASSSATRTSGRPTATARCRAFAPNSSSPRPTSPRVIRDHAPGGFNARYAAGWASFLAATAPWLRYVEDAGPAAVTAHFAAMVAGRVDPAEGVILRLAA